MRDRGREGGERRREGEKEKTFCSRTKGSAKVEREGEGGERKGTWV